MEISTLTAPYTLSENHKTLPIYYLLLYIFYLLNKKFIIIYVL